MKTLEDHIEELYLGRLIDPVGCTYALAFEQTDSPGFRAEICQMYNTMCIFMTRQSFFNHKDAVSKGTEIAVTNDLIQTAVSFN